MSLNFPAIFWYGQKFNGLSYSVVNKYDLSVKNFKCLGKTDFEFTNKYGYNIVEYWMGVYIFFRILTSVEFVESVGIYVSNNFDATFLNREDGGGKM